MKSFAILILSTILVSSIILNVYSIPNKEKLNYNEPTSNSNSSNIVQPIQLPTHNFKNANLSSIDNNKVKGLLKVIVSVDNKDIGNKTPSDFTIHIYANDPSTISFLGNSSGTDVKLGMGMYSVSESLPRGYNLSYSSDCFGGIMLATIKKCIISNTYTNTSSN
ncbi:MAG: hypothetical protein M3Z01_09340 [Thermoproteota archaeon]|nr:hypothetical protein [Thermoproteota archaeon]